MSQLLTHLQAHAQAPMGHVYVIGAGDGSQLPQWRALDAQQLWLAEAHPTLATRLMARTQGHEHETVTQAAITGQAEEHANLHLLNLPGKSSLSAPTQLKSYFPNVQEQGSKQVAAQAFNTWAAHAEEDADHEHLLVIDSPGQAFQLISDTPARTLQQFAWVHITAAEEALYEQDAPISEIDKLLQQRGYTCCKEDADTQYPLIARLYQRQPSVVERLALEATIIALREEVEQAQADAKAAHATAKKEQEALVIARSEATKQSQSLEETKQQLAERDKQLEESRATANSEATRNSQALEDAKKQLAERDQQLSAKTQLLEETNTACDNAKSEAQRLTQALAEANATTKSKHEAYATTKSQAESLAKELEEIRAAAKSEATKHAQALEDAKKQLAERSQQLSEKTKALEDTKAARDNAKSEAQQLTQALENATKQLAERDQQLNEKAKAFDDAEAARVIARNEATKHAQALEDAKKQLAERDQQLSEKAKAFEETKAARENANSVAANLAKELEETRATAKSEATKQSQALEDANKQIEALTQQLASRENSLHNTEERFSSLESKLNQLFGEQRSYIQQTTNALGQHVTRSAQQQRDEQALTHYLHHGQRPISTELAPNFAMALLERRETQRYDVMVVLGSSPITELLAQAVVNEARHQPRLTAQHQTENGKDVQHYVTPSQDDLPQAVISVAHKKSICKALKQRLAANHTQEAVSVVHAPWVEANKKGDLFYAWEVTLQRLNQWLEEDANVLVVIGNALAEANHHRIASLPQLLQYLPTQTLDVIVEGNHYPHESELEAEWEALLNKRQREAETLALPTALGLRVAG